ncbi:MAG: hypothetical protein ACLPT4_11235 [Verrucomicrobiia bacterium]
MLKLIADNHDVYGLILVLGVTFVSNVLMHWIAICPSLYRRGARFPTGLLFWRVFAELRRYKEVTTAAAGSLTVYYLDFILTWFNLLLAFATALRLLWLQSHPLGY